MKAVSELDYRQTRPGAGNSGGDTIGVADDVSMYAVRRFTT